MIGVSFDSTKTPLQDLLARADGGSLRLVDFHCRGVWDYEHITREPKVFRRGVVAEVDDEGPTECDAEEPLEEASP